jgi:hypothetical protein
VARSVSNIRRIYLGPGLHLIGAGRAWKAKVGRDFDRSRVATAKRELREALQLKIEMYQSKIEGQEKLDLLNELTIAIRGSDTVLFSTARLIGTKPSGGLFEKIEAILRNNYDKQ